MIRQLTVAVPHTVVGRIDCDADALASFERTTGILRTRRWGVDDPETLRLSVLHAAIDVRDRMMKEDLEDIEGVILVTQSPWRFSPACAIDVAATMGLRSDVKVFDVNQSCCGFVYALELASSFGGPVVVACGDRLRYGRETSLESLIFSDAACVAVVDDIGFGWSRFENDWQGMSKLYARREGGEMFMDGAAVFDWATFEVPRILRAYGCENGYDFLCGHQPNEAMMRLIDKRSGFEGRSLRSIHQYGNQSMVSIPTALALNEEQILGKRVLLAGYGAGFSAAFMGITWSPKPVSRIIETSW